MPFFGGWQGTIEVFVRIFSAVAAPLIELLSPKTRFYWSESCQRAFECNKALLTNAPVVAAPAFDRPFKLAVDASKREWVLSSSKRELMGWSIRFCIF